MTHETEERLNGYVDGTLAAAEGAAVARHLAACPSCRGGVQGLEALKRAAAALPRSIDPPASVWIRVARRTRGRPAARRARTLALSGLAAAAVLALILARAEPGVGGGSGWRIERLAGAPSVGDGVLDRGAMVRVGDWVATDDSSHARILVGTIGRVDVLPGSRVRLVAAAPTDHRLALANGAIDAQVDAPPRLFFVETAAGTAIDLGCAYTMEVDSAGNGVLRVTGGWVEFRGHGRRALVPLGFAVRMYGTSGPGIPVAADAPAELKRALAALDTAAAGGAALRRALAAARPEDAVSVWHLLARAEEDARARVAERLASLVLPPAGVTPEGLVALDAEMLDRYWETIRRIAWRRVLLEGIRDVEPRTGLTRRADSLP